MNDDKKRRLSYGTALTALIERDARTAQILPDTGPSDGVWGPATEVGIVHWLDEEWSRICADHGWRYTCSAERPRTSGGLRGREIERTILHWPGSGDWTAHRLDLLIDLRAGGRGEGQGSTHFAIDECEVVCCCAPHRVAWHARAHNWDSIGIDICVSPLDEGSVRRRGLWGGYVTWGGSPQHGDRWCALHPVLAQRAYYLWRALSAILGETAVYDHAYVDPHRKIDCVPWRPVLARQPWKFNEGGPQ